MNVFRREDFQHIRKNIENSRKGFVFSRAEDIVKNTLAGFNFKRLARAGKLGIGVNERGGVTGNVKLGNNGDKSVGAVFDDFFHLLGSEISAVFAVLFKLAEI